MMDEKRIAELRKERNSGMVSAVGEYTPAEFWEALDEIENLRAALVDTLDFVERHSNRWDGVNGKHPMEVVTAARMALGPNA